MTRETYLNGYNYIKFNYELHMMDIINYLNREISIDELNPILKKIVRSRDGAYQHIENFNKEVKKLGDFRASHLDLNLPSVDHFLILPKFEEDDRSK